MYRIDLLNKISEKGLRLFTPDYEYREGINDADAILVRSKEMKEMALPASVKAIARAGAGVNNIPIDKCSEKGIVVFNTPGANANGVKELVILGMLCLLYTSDAADDLLCVDCGGRRIIKKKKNKSTD